MMNNNICQEDISLVLEEQGFNVRVSSFTADVPMKGAIIKNCFTLMGTKSDKTLISMFPGFNGIPNHPGYTSVGLVDKVGAECRYLKKGEKVLMPAIYSKFLTLDASRLSFYSKYLFTRLTDDIDVVSALFIPLVSLAIYLVRKLDLTSDEYVCLFGCNLLGIIILRILQYEGKRAIVCLNQDKIDCELIYSSGIDKIYSLGELEDQLDEDIEGAIILTPENILTEFVEQKLDCEIVNANLNPETTEMNKPIWLSYDSINEASEIIKKKNIIVNDLIYRHIHIDVFDDVYESILKNLYQGKALVYDW